MRVYAFTPGLPAQEQRRRATEAHERAAREPAVRDPARGSLPGLVAMW